MSAAHTPGPWRYVRDSDYWEIAPTQIGGKDNYEGNEADYRLIAAAPDLLVALTQMNHALEGGYCICPLSDGHAPDNTHATVCQDARAAIAKALAATEQT